MEQGAARARSARGGRAGHVVEVLRGVRADHAGGVRDVSPEDGRMKLRFEVIVSLKEGLLDSQGKAVQDALPTMGWTNVTDVRVGKHVQLTVEAADEAAASEQVEEIARKLLSNPVIEDFTVLEMEAVQ